MKARRWFVGICSLGFALALLTLWFYSRWDRFPIRYRNYEKIQIGMTRAEVDELLGCRCGDYSTGPIEMKVTRDDGSVAYRLLCHPRAAFDNGVEDEGDGRSYVWQDDHCMVRVHFDREQKVWSKEGYSGRRMRPNWWLRLERTLRLNS